MAAPSSETPILDLLASMTADSLAASGLDPETLMLVRIAALAAVDAPPVSYLLNLEAAAAVGIDAEQVRGVLAAIAPIVGTARVASATGASSTRSRVEIEVAELEAAEAEADSHRGDVMASDSQPAYGESTAWQPERPRLRLLPLVLSWLAMGIALMVAAGLLPGVCIDSSGGAARRGDRRSAERGHPARARCAATAAHASARLPAGTARGRRHPSPPTP